MSNTSELPLGQNGPIPRTYMTGDSDYRRPMIPWKTVAAVAAVISTCGGGLIALGRTMFASKDEHTELKIHVQEHKSKVDEALGRLERGTDKLMNTIERLDRNVTILNTRVGMVEDGAPPRRPQR